MGGELAPGRRHDDGARHVDWLTARQEVLALARLVATESRRPALGDVVAADIVAQRDVPPFAASAMDGFAVGGNPAHAGRFVVLSASGAGEQSGITLREGEAQRVMTGSVVPHGTWAVIPRELASDGGSWVEVPAADRAGAFVRPAGSDVARGATIARRGDVVTPALASVLGAQGLTTLPVFRRPRVGILSTGRELRRPGQPTGDSGIYDGNGPALAALVESLGAIAVDLGIADETQESVRDALVYGSRACDVVLSTGGVSAGDTDVVQTVLLEMGDPAAILRIGLKPAKPLAYGLVGAVPVLGLPGNPVSALVSAWIFAVGLIDSCAGKTRVGPHVVWAQAAAPFAGPHDGKVHLVRAHLSSTPSGLVVSDPTVNDSSRSLDLARANVVVVLTPGGGDVDPGAVVPAIAVEPGCWGVPFDQAAPFLGPVAPTSVGPTQVVGRW